MSDPYAQRVADLCVDCKTRERLRFAHSPHGGIRVVCDGCDGFGARTYTHDAAIALWNAKQRERLGE